MTAIFIDANELVSLLSRIPAWGRVRLERRRLAPLPGGAELVERQGVDKDTLQTLATALDARIVSPAEFYMRGRIYDLERVGVVVADPGDKSLELIIMERL